MVELTGSLCYPGPPRGKDHALAKLTEDDVRKIRKLHEEGLGYVKISRVVGVSANQVSRVVKRKSWAHVE